MIIQFSGAEMTMIERLKKTYNLPSIPSDWDYETSEMYRDAANELAVLKGLDADYKPNKIGLLLESISDKLFLVP